jgi:hypothetical protein
MACHWPRSDPGGQTQGGRGLLLAELGGWTHCQLLAGLGGQTGRACYWRGSEDRLTLLTLPWLLALGERELFFKLHGSLGFGSGLGLQCSCSLSWENVPSIRGPWESRMAHLNQVTSDMSVDRASDPPPASAWCCAWTLSHRAYPPSPADPRSLPPPHPSLPLSLSPSLPLSLSPCPPLANLLDQPSDQVIRQCTHWAWWRSRS